MPLTTPGRQDHPGARRPARLLLPLSIAELAGAGIAFPQFEDYIHHGFLPRVHDQQQRPTTAYGNYYQTYVELDVRQLIQLHDAGLFGKFIKLLAGRVGQPINCSSLAADVGVDAKTVKSWLSILEASFIVFALTPWSENFGKRVIKSPKYYFTEPGLLAWLLDPETPAQAGRDPLVGSLFENLVIVEALEARYNRGQAAQLHFFRDSHGNQIDLLYRRGGELTGIEIRAASTWSTSFRKNLLRFSENYHALVHQSAVYNGEPMRFSDGVEAVSFREVGGLA